MTELSPSAQAVLAAINKELDEAPWDLTFIAGSAAAAALRAAADQVAPEDYSSYTCHPEHDIAMEERNDSVRKAILAIADELEAQ